MIDVLLVGSYKYHTDYTYDNLRVSFADGLGLMEESKIVVNQMVWFKDGGSERVFNAMLQGSVCVMDGSIYLKEHFESKENIIFYSLDALEELPDIVKDLFGQLEKMQRIADHGYKTALAHHTWEQRAKELAARISDRA